MITCPHCLTKRRKGNSCRKCGRVDLDALRSIRISYEVNPSRMNNVAPRSPNNSFEKGIRKDERGIPYLDTNAKPLRMKESFNPKHYKRSDKSIKVSTGGNS
jgi:hypothetical protein